jgi:hypothetical protein
VPVGINDQRSEVSFFVYQSVVRFTIVFRPKADGGTLKATR